MKNPIQKFRRIFFRGKKFNTSTARPAMAAPRDDDDDNGHQLSGAFVVVLLLHVIAIIGVFAFARIREKNKAQTSLESPAQIAATKSSQAKPNPAKPPAAKPAQMIAAAVPAPAAQAIPAHDSLKVPQAGQRTTHIVQVDDRLEKIAFAYNVTIPGLVAANHLKNREDIRAGQALTIPESKTAAKNSPVAETKLPAPVPANDRKTPKIYIVKKNDTAVKIAREHGCTYEELVKLNSIKDPKKIQLGQVLKLPVKTL